MATTQLTLTAERWLDEVILGINVADVGAATLDESFSLPSGLGDVAILSIQVTISSIATVPVTATLPRGVAATVTSPDGSSLVDVVGVAAFYAIGGDGAAFTTVRALIDPDALALWRTGELVRVRGPEMDAGATGDLQINFKCVRVRPIEAPASTVLQLVR